MAALETRAETFERLAVIDPLTELYNRRFAKEHLPIEIARASRQGYALTALMLDLNDFKAINDRYGHAAGRCGAAGVRASTETLLPLFRPSGAHGRATNSWYCCRNVPSDRVPKVLLHLRGLHVDHAGEKIADHLCRRLGRVQGRRDRGRSAGSRRPGPLLRQADAQCRDSRCALPKRKWRSSRKWSPSGQMTGGVAHDFNNLLTIIRGYSELLLDFIPAGDALRDKVEEIDRAAQRAATLTRQLLSLQPQAAAATGPPCRSQQAGARHGDHDSRPARPAVSPVTSRPTPTWA